jgi:hypothetical protein
VNRSEGTYDRGRGETDDARVALDTLRERYPELPRMVGGFSFGSRVTLRLASERPDVERVIAVGFPTRIAEREFVDHVTVPKYFVQSTNDEFGPAPEFGQFFSEVPEPKHLDWVPAADHFFRDNLDGYEAVIERIGREGRV